MYGNWTSVRLSEDCRHRGGLFVVRCAGGAARGDRVLQGSSDDPGVRLLFEALPLGGGYR
jgi:hypothetical protein